MKNRRTNRKTNRKIGGNSFPNPTIKTKPGSKGSNRNKTLRNMVKDVQNMFSRTKKVQPVHSRPRSYKIVPTDTYDFTSI